MSDAALRALERRAQHDPAARAALGLAECRAHGHPAWEHVYFRLTEEDMLDSARVQTSDGACDYRRWRCPRCGEPADVYLTDDRPRCRSRKWSGWQCGNPPLRDGMCAEHAKLTPDERAALSVPPDLGAWWDYWGHREGCTPCRETDTHCGEGLALHGAYVAAETARAQAREAVPHAP